MHFHFKSGFDTGILSSCISMWKNNFAPVKRTLELLTLTSDTVFSKAEAACASRFSDVYFLYFLGYS